MIIKAAEKKGKIERKASTRKVPFEFSSPEAKEVYLVGEFNHWDRDANPMKKDKKGVWKATLSLKPGRYEYRFLVDTIWTNDIFCSGCVPNEFGSQNCVKTVE
jgi:1,4-alpha-glucan branching enzyme